MIQNAKIVALKANADDYHKNGVERGNPAHPVSSSMLKSFNQCPARWRAGYQSPGSDAMRFGSLLDCRLLTPEAFTARFAVRPNTILNDVLKCPKCGSVTDSKTCRKCGVDRVVTTETRDWNGNAEACKAWLANQGERAVISTKEQDECDIAIHRLKSDELIASWLDACDTQVWITAEWKDKATGLTVPLKALLDFVPRKETEFATSLGDLKTVTSGALQPFAWQVHKYGWHVQSAFYTDLFVAATGEDRNTWCFFGCENYPPYEPLRRLLSVDFVEIGRKTYQHALSRYCRCLKNDTWPGYDSHSENVQGMSVILAEPWMDYEAASDAMRVDQEQPEDEQEDIGVTP